MTVSRDVLVGILTAVLPGLAKKGDLPQAQCFIFADGEVITFNDRITIHHPLPKGLDALQGAVKAQELYRVLLKMPEGMDINVEMTDAEIHVTTASIKAAVRRDQEIVNRYSSVATPSSFTAVPDGLLDALHFASFSASTDLSKPIITHVYAEKDQVMSCDNRRVTVRSFKGKVPPMFIPATIISDLRSYCPVEFATGEGWSHWRNAVGTLFSFRTIEAKYPSVLSFFEGATSWPVVSFPSGTQAAVDRVAEVLDSQAILPPVDITFKDKKIIISGKGPYASMKERLTCEYDGNISFSIAAEFLSDILSLGVTAHVSSDRLCLVNKDESFRHLVCLAKKEETAEAK